MTTTEKVLAMRERDPRRTATDMAAEFGVSRERISQILDKQGLPTRFNNAPRCIGCGKKVGRHGILRCRPCQHAFIRAHQPCSWCGEPATRLHSRIASNKSDAIFCNRSHRSKWLWGLTNSPIRIGLAKHYEKLRRGLTLLEAQEAVDTESGG